MNTNLHDLSSLTSLMVVWHDHCVRIETWSTSFDESHNIVGSSGGVVYVDRRHLGELIEELIAIRDAPREAK